MRNSLWIIKGVNIFTGMDPGVQEKISKASRIDKFPKEQIFSLPNAPAYSVYFLNKGRMRYVRLLSENREGVSLDIVTGEVFGRIPGKEDLTYPSFLEALEDIEIRVLSRSDFQKFVADGTKDIVFSLYALRGILRAQIENPIWSLLYKDVPERLAALLLALGKKYGKESGGGLMIRVRCDSKSLAYLSGSSADYVALTLAGFLHKGYIGMKKNRIILKNQEALRALVRKIVSL